MLAVPWLLSQPDQRFIARLALIDRIPPQAVRGISLRIKKCTGGDRAWKWTDKNLVYSVVLLDTPCTVTSGTTCLSLPKPGEVRS
jgi:hypothetical protein